MNFSTLFVLTTLWLNTLALTFVQATTNVVAPVKKKMTRIVGGKETTISDIGGYIVAMRYYGRFICGGSYVAERIVITAAHCVEWTKNNLDALTIEGGITSLREKAERIDVAKAAIPRAYRKSDNHMDVAVLKLKKPLKGKKIKMIDLCDVTVKVGDKMIVSGWGFTAADTGMVMDVVRTVEVPIISKKQCTKVYKDANDITDSMICAGVLGQKDACSADSGGPMVYQKKLCGIVSFGVGCADEKYPGVYTDVKFILPFINSAIKKLRNS